MELLVVIGIIAILAALTLAMLGRGKDQANRAACLSNLREIHSLVARFAGDNDGALPLGYRLGQKQFNTTLYTASGSQYVLLGKLLAYAKDPRVFFCPSERDPTQAYNTKDNPWPIQAGKNLQGGYATNPLTDWAAADFPETPIKLLGIERTPLLADGVGMPKRVDSRHKDGVNVVFSDGSGRWVAREKFNSDLSGCTAIGAGNNAAQDRIWQILAEKDPNEQTPQ
jgi:prepilin-type processing-associated H-X9-DG protein